MPTSFDIVIDQALITVNDYKLINLFQQNEEKFIKRCDAFLVRAIPNFFRCRTSLDYDLTQRIFINELSATEISILADLWVLEWFKDEIQVSASVANTLQISGGFHVHSPAQALKEKSTYDDKLREKVQQKITDYQLQNLDDIL